MQIFKQSIGPKFKNMLWDMYNDTESTVCPCCNITTIFKNDYSAGHIISEATGGIVSFYNMIPICRKCNNKMGQQNLLTYAQQNFNSHIKTLPEFDKYKQQIENNENILYNTRQITKNKFIIEFVIKLVNYIKNNNLINEIKNFVMDEKQCGDIEYEKWNFTKIQIDDYIYSDIEIIKKISHNIKYKKYYINFKIKPSNTYKLYIQSQTDEILNIKDILTTINPNKMIMKKYPYLDYTIDYDIIDINEKKCIIIDNIVYLKNTLNNSTGAIVGEVINNTIHYY